LFPVPLPPLPPAPPWNAMLFAPAAPPAPPLAPEAFCPWAAVTVTEVPGKLVSVAVPPEPIVKLIVPETARAVSSA
jgi:hypothetical protein